MSLYFWRRGACLASMLFSASAQAQMPQMELQLGHSDGVRALQFSPDGRWLASGGERVTKLWDVRSGELIRTLPGGTETLRFLPDGRLAATGDGEARFWNLRDGSCRRLALISGPSWEWSSEVSPDGALVAWTRGQDGYNHPNDRNAILLTDARSGARRGMLRWPPEKNEGNNDIRVRSHCFSQDGKLLAAAFETGKVRVWDVDAGTLRKTFKLHKFGANRMAFAPDGKTLVIAGQGIGDEVHLWALTTNRAIVQLADADSGTWSLVFSPDGSLVATNNGVWDVGTGRLLRRFSSFGDIAFSPDGGSLARGDDRILLEDARSGAIIRHLPNHTIVEPVAFSPDGKTLMAGRCAWDLTTCRLKFARDMASPVAQAAFTSNSLILSLTRRDGDHHFSELWWCDAETGQLQSSRELLTAGIIAPGGRFVTSNRDRGVKIVDMQTGKTHGPFEAGGAFAFAPDGSRFATAIEDIVKIWDSANGKAITSLPNPLGPNRQLEFDCVALSARGKYVAAGERDTTLFVWDAATKKVLRRFAAGHEVFLLFSPDEKTLVAVGDTTRLWDVPGGRLKATLPATGKPTFSPDGRLLALSTSDGVQLWQAADGRLLATLVVLPSEQDGERLTGTPQWICVTPDGFYDGSPGVGRFIRWRVGEGLHAAEEFAVRFHRPDLVSKNVEAK